MTPTTIISTEVCQDTTTIVTADAQSNTTTTETITDNQTTTTTATRDDDAPDQTQKCPCGNLDLRKLVEQTRCWAFKSSNVAAATANGVLIFAMKILQEILISECESDNANIDNIFLIASAIGEIAQIIEVYNPQPFNS